AIDHRRLDRARLLGASELIHLSRRLLVRAPSRLIEQEVEVAVARARSGRMLTGREIEVEPGGLVRLRLGEEIHVDTVLPALEVLVDEVNVCRPGLRLQERILRGDRP